MVNYKLKYLKYKLKYQKLKGGTLSDEQYINFELLLKYFPLEDKYDKDKLLQEFKFNNYDLEKTVHAVFEDIDYYRRRHTPASLIHTPASPIHTPASPIHTPFSLDTSEIQQMIDELTLDSAVVPPLAGQPPPAQPSCLNFNFSSEVLSVYSSDKISDFRKWLIEFTQDAIKTINPKPDVLRLFNLVLIRDGDNLVVHIRHSTVVNSFISQSDSHAVGLMIYSREFVQHLMLNEEKKRELIIHLQNYLIDFLSKSHITIDDLFSDTQDNTVEAVEISFDVYLDRKASYGAKFHQDATSQFKSKFVSLSYDNENLMPGPEIFLKSDRSIRSTTLVCDYFRPGIPKNGTIVFRDDKLFHASPYKSLLENIPSQDSLHNIDDIHQSADVALSPRFQDCRRIEFKSKFPNVSRHEWELVPDKVRSFIRVWVMPQTDMTELRDVQNQKYIYGLFTIPYPQMSDDVQNINIDKECGIFYG
jgi:hypothetical protein